MVVWAKRVMSDYNRKAPKTASSKQKDWSLNIVLFLKWFKLGVLETKWNPARKWLSAMVQGCRMCSPWPASCAGWAQRWKSSSAKTPQCSRGFGRCGSSGALDAKWWSNWANSTTLLGGSLESHQVVWFSKSALLFPWFWIWETLGQTFWIWFWISTILKPSKS